MLKRLRYVVAAAAVAGVLSGCEQPEIHEITASALEDQTPVVSANIKTSGNMRSTGASVDAIAPTVGVVPPFDMQKTSTSGGIAVFEGAAPAPLAYGTTWKATVGVRYRMLWQDFYVRKSVDFIVGGAKPCSSFDGALGRQGWGEEMRLRQVPEGTQPITSSTPTHWLPNENARPSAVTGALGVTIPDIQFPHGRESWVGEFLAGRALFALSHGSGVRLAVKTSGTIRMHLAVHALNVADGPNHGWSYSNNKIVEAGDWQIVELPFPTLPPPNSSAGVTMDVLTVNVANLSKDMQIAIDDVCPMP